MSFHLTIRHRFPAALQQREYLSFCNAALQRAGLTAENTLVGVSRCRDEVTAALPQALESMWGSTFDLASLAGVFSAGATGLSAARSHVPALGGRSNLVVFALTHVGIDDAGTIGLLPRPGTDHPSATCGSLAAANRALASGGHRGRQPDLSDIEQWRVEQLLAPLVDPATEYDLADLAELALTVAEREVLTAIQTIGDDPEATLGLDGALFSGIQIHGPLDKHYIWPSLALIERNGELIVDPDLPTAAPDPPPE